ncbi:cysteine/glutathione ABC transporter ATP-binding protein/permease CydC [Glaesserella parasuis]|uniref:Glutathione/L-cysteine transport system ATP-binding/permease protein CydC n=1 Tax=Glaesserella parasuis serovar 5 (strain SH0165) TaxID=557723 RepID=B8F3L4_GLAP5|nr:cysteine/glutathione ABC transporter ATP-binding protein/permease CydC [Glaesserella parasuis]ACL31916.1 cysteine/glutathione ABC transporter [Glaesserella parasuis SH0165]MDG6236909.1 cysteine/glutathione ABC transporter ATP-binding protein/permease CydC [Glaesserella parasuis]MDG6868136.1 cysteine/glutathione ABC transporter ATP-binding protein/permease CydC [Glaesserella parasuis]MDP0207354.1 cysteine/glutathione ABC transporter ATP-binding protein/permease CydC [Glaesserella parasuis]MW
MRSLFPFLALYKTHFGRLILGIILAITSLTASIGLLSLSGWFLAASALVGSSLLFNFFYPSSGVRGLAIGRTISRYFERLVTHDATFRVLANLRIAVFSKLIPLSPAGLNRYRHSELLNRLVADVDTLDTLYLNLLSPFISAIMVILFMGIGLSFVSPLLAWVICGTLVALLLIFPTLFYHLGRKLGKIAIQSRATYRSQFIEWIQLNGEFLLFGVLSKATDRLKQTEQQWLKAQSHESQLGGLSNALLMFINGILVTAVIYLSAAAINVPQADNPEALIALVVFCVLASLEILMPIGMAFLHLGQVIEAAERISEITAQQPTVQFNGTAQWKQTEANQPLISFNQVSFSYSPEHEQVLNHISFEIKKGERIAILGKTGSGKSTIFQLLTRNYDATSGEILLNGCNIKDYPEKTLRQQIAVLSQRVHIFSNTLRENLRFGSPQATDEALSEALAKVNLSYLLEEQGLDLWLGEGGRPLSGGEQRRLGLARLLLSTADILLLDEATEGLDRDTEQQILKQILSHTQGKTLLMITHRLNGVEQFDRVYRIASAILR